MFLFNVCLSRCKIFQLTTYATAFVSIYTLVLMSLDRFLAVVFPIRSMTWRTDCNCIIGKLFSLIYSFYVFDTFLKFDLESNLEFYALSIPYQTNIFYKYWFHLFRYAIQRDIDDLQFHFKSALSNCISNETFLWKQSNWNCLST